MAESQLLKEAPETLRSLKKMMSAIAVLGYKTPKVLKSEGSEFSSAEWKKFNLAQGWKRIWTKDYPAVHVERKIRTLKKYLYLNSIGNYGMETLWFNVLSTSVKATNRILNKIKKASPEQIIKMDIVERRRVRDRIKEGKRRQNSNYTYKPRKDEPVVGSGYESRAKRWHLITKGISPTAKRASQLSGRTSFIGLRKRQSL